MAKTAEELIQDADFFHDDDWEFTHPDLYNVTENLEEGLITEVHLLKVMPSVFVAVIDDEDRFFLTREEAEAAVEAATKTKELN